MACGRAEPPPYGPIAIRLGQEDASAIGWPINVDPTEQVEFSSIGM